MKNLKDYLKMIVTAVTCFLMGFVKREKEYDWKLGNVWRNTGNNVVWDNPKAKMISAYIVKDNEPSLELKVKVINIRPEEHHEILEKCQVLKEYSQFMEIVQNYQISGVEEPYKKAIKECIEKGILADYLMRKISKWRTGWT